MESQADYRKPEIDQLIVFTCYIYVIKPKNVNYSINKVMNKGYDR